MLCLIRSLCRHQTMLPSFMISGAHISRLVSSVPEERLHEHFNKVMKREEVPLFRSFDVYSKSLPVRECNGEVLHLHQYPLYVNMEELTSMANRLFLKTKNIRHVVKYLAAPSASGKTASILHAFLNHVEGGGECTHTHYVYLSFSNNQDNFYRLLDSVNISTFEDTAEGQGADFIYSSLKHLLEESPTSEVGSFLLCNKEPPPQKKTLSDMTNYLRDMFGGESRILFHLDEHRMMCSQKQEEGTAFCRGALGTLAKLPNATVVATYTSIPPSPRNFRQPSAGTLYRCQVWMCML